MLLVLGSIRLGNVFLIFASVFPHVLHMPWEQNMLKIHMANRGQEPIIILCARVVRCIIWPQFGYTVGNICRPLFPGSVMLWNRLFLLFVFSHIPVYIPVPVSLKESGTLYYRWHLESGTRLCSPMTCLIHREIEKWVLEVSALPCGGWEAGCMCL